MGNCCGKCCGGSPYSATSTIPAQPASSRELEEVSSPPKETTPTIRETTNELVEFSDIKDGLKTGDLLLLYRKDAETPNYGIIINNAENEQYFPLLLAKGTTKPMQKESFIRQKRYLTLVTATTRIFYGDYERVAVCRLMNNDETISPSQAMQIVHDIEYEDYSAEEITLIEEAESPAVRSTLTSVLNLGLVYHKLGILKEHVIDVKGLLHNWHTSLPVGEPEFIKVPPIRPGPMKRGEPPLYQKLLRGLMPFSEGKHVSYSSIRDQLNTGDIILFSTVGVGGFFIKLGSAGQFSHSGVILKPRGSDLLMVWEAASNSVGIVDLGSCEVQAGTQIVPLKHKIFNGYNDEVAIRRLVDVTDEQREIIHEKMMKLSKEHEGKKYEKNLFNLAKAQVDFADEFLTFLKNDEEDVSTLFCSELVAHAYQEAGLLGDEIPFGEYTPSDFASSNEKLQLKVGRLEPEVYIQLKYED